MKTAEQPNSVSIEPSVKIAISGPDIDGLLTRHVNREYGCISADEIDENEDTLAGRFECSGIVVSEFEVPGDKKVRIVTNVADGFTEVTLR